MVTIVLTYHIIIIILWQWPSDWVSDDLSVHDVRFNTDGVPAHYFQIKCKETILYAHLPDRLNLKILW